MIPSSTIDLASDLGIFGLHTYFRTFFCLIPPSSLVSISIAHHKIGTFNEVLLKPFEKLVVTSKLVQVKSPQLLFLKDCFWLCPQLRA